MARGEGTVLVRVIGEIRDLASKLRQGGDDVGRFATRSRSLITKSFSDITSIVTSRFGRMGAEAQKSLDGMAAKAAATGSGIGLALGAGALAGGAAVVALAEKGIAAFLHLAGQIRAVQRVSGATAEEASRLTGEFNALGIDVSAGTTAFFMLSKNIDANADKLRDHRIEIARNHDGSIDLYQTLLNVRSAYQATTNAEERNVIASAALGRGGKALLPILAATSERLKEIDDAAKRHHEWMTQDQIDKAKELGIRVTDLKHSVEGLAIETGEQLAPNTATAVSWMTKLVEKADELSKKGASGHGGFFRTLVDLVPGVRELNLVTDRFGKKSKDAGNAAEEAAAGVDDLSASLDEQASAADAATSSLAAYDKMLQGITDSVLGIPTALDDVDQAFIDLEANSQSATTKAGDAQTRLADAIESANRRIRDAEQEVSDAREDLNKQASGDRTDARRRLRDAEERLSDAHADSAKSIADAKSNADDLGGSIKSAKEQAIELDRKMGNFDDKVKIAVEKMVAAGTPTSEILAYITSQRDRLGEIGTRLGVNKTQLQLYLDVLTQVYQTTKDIADLVNGSPRGPFDSYKAWGAELNPLAKPGASPAATGGVNVTNNFYVNPGDTQQIARDQQRAYNSALRRRG